MVVVTAVRQQADVLRASGGGGKSQEDADWHLLPKTPSKLFLDHFPTRWHHKVAKHHFEARDLLGTRAIRKEPGALSLVMCLLRLFPFLIALK